jgi:serine/threonine protein kinase
MSEAREAPVDLGRYVLLARIASGGMGTVHVGRARGERGFTRPVAIKLLHAHLLSDETAVKRFLDEARVASHVQHPHVVSVLDVGESKGSPFLVLDYVHGVSLDVLFRASQNAGEPPSLPVVSAIVGDVLEGLQAAHDAVDGAGVRLGLVHRDVTPHNVLVSSQGAAYVTDFGIAKVRDRIRVTATNDVLGKPGYMAPEQIAAGTVSPATDIHGAGLVLWEALTGQKLYRSLEQQMFALASRLAPDPPSMHRPEVPPELDALVLSMLARDPDERPRKALACAERLAELVPRAPASEVAEWVTLHAQGRLDRLDEALRTPVDDSDVATVTMATPATPATSGEPARSTPSTPRKLIAVGVGVAVTVLVGGAFALGLVFARPAVNDPAAAAASSSSSSSSVASGTESLAGPEESVTTSPLSGASASASATATAPTPASRATSRVRTRPPGTARAQPGCDPPYVITDGIKHWKRECFASRGE